MTKYCCKAFDDSVEDGSLDLLEGGYGVTGCCGTCCVLVGAFCPFCGANTIESVKRFNEFKSKETFKAENI